MVLPGAASAAVLASVGAPRMVLVLVLIAIGFVLLAQQRLKSVQP